MYWAVVFSGHPTTIGSLRSVPAITLTIWAIWHLPSPYFLGCGFAALEIVQKVFVDRFCCRMGACRHGNISAVAYRPLPQLFGLIIGLHFVPIAKVFHLPRYYWVGAIMIAGELSSLLLPRGDMRNIFACACIGLTLWINGLIILSRISTFTNRRAPILS